MSAMAISRQLSVAIRNNALLTAGNQLFNLGYRKGNLGIGKHLAQICSALCLITDDASAIAFLALDQFILADPLGGLSVYHFVDVQNLRSVIRTSVQVDGQ